MRISKPATDKKWVFKVIDGPTVEDIMAQFFNKEGDNSPRELKFCFEQSTDKVHIGFEQTPFEWFGPVLTWREARSKTGWASVVSQKLTRTAWIRVKITKIEKISSFCPLVVLTGYCLDVNSKEYPFAFKAIYSMTDRKGKFIFSFKYGRWTEIDNSEIGKPNSFIKVMIVGKKKVMRV